MLPISVHVLINDNLTGLFPRNSTLTGMTESLELGLEKSIISLNSYGMC